MHLLLLLVVLGAHYACTINTLVDIEQVYAIFGIPRDYCSEKEGIAKLSCQNYRASYNPFEPGFSKAARQTAPYNQLKTAPCARTHGQKRCLLPFVSAPLSATPCGIVPAL
jgi:hypothetical protein